MAHVLGKDLSGPLSIKWYAEFSSNEPTLNALAVYSIRQGVVIVTMILFMFIPMLVKYLPSKPEPYKKLKKHSHEECHAEPLCYRDVS